LVLTDVSNETSVTENVETGEEFVQELTGVAHEREITVDFVGARGFTDNCKAVWEVGDLGELIWDKFGGSYDGVVD
jgi:hypothetical protein